MQSEADHDKQYPLPVKHEMAVVADSLALQKIDLVGVTENGVIVAVDSETNKYFYI